MLPTSTGVEPATSLVGRRIQLSHRGQLPKELLWYPSHLELYVCYCQTVQVNVYQFHETDQV